MTDYMVAFSAEGKANVVELSAPNLEVVELFACKQLHRENWPVPTTYKIFEFPRSVLDDKGEIKARGKKNLVLERTQ